MTAARAYIAERYGAESLPAEPNVYKNKKRAQDAHEAIRPTLWSATRRRCARRGRRRAAVAKRARPRTAQALHADLAPLRRVADGAGGLRPDHGRHRARARVGLRATGQVMKFAGYTRSTRGRGADDARAAEDEPRTRCPSVARGRASCACSSVQPEQHFTQPPPRFTEASLVKELEENGIGRPSTYAAIMSTIVRTAATSRRRRAGCTRPSSASWSTGCSSRASPRSSRRDFTAKMEERARPGRGRHGRLAQAARRRSTRRSSSSSRRPRPRCATSSARRSRPSRSARSAASRW